MSIDVRLRNRAEVLATVVRENGISRKRISHLTGLSQPTISRVIEQLIDEGLVFESGEIQEDRRGRRSILVNLDANKHFALGIDLGAVNTRLVFLDSSGSVRAIREVQTPREKNPSELAFWLGEQAKKISGQIPSKSIHTSIGLPGAVNPQNNLVSNAPNLPQIEDIQFVERLRVFFDLNLKFDNDANYAALGEFRYGSASGSNSTAMITLGLGLGVGLIQAGQVCQGATGLVGEFGQLPFGEANLPVEKAITWASIQENLKSIDFVGVHPEQFFLDQNADALKNVRMNFSNGLFLVSAAIVASIEPEVLVIGGGISPLLSREVIQLQNRLQSAFGYAPTIKISELGNFSGAIGAAIDSLKRYFEESGISSDRLADLPPKQPFEANQIPGTVVF